MDITKEIKKFAEEECKKLNANYPTIYEFHLTSMHGKVKDKFEAALLLLG